MMFTGVSKVVDLRKSARGFTDQPLAINLELMLPKLVDFTLGTLGTYIGNVTISALVLVTV